MSKAKEGKAKSDKTAPTKTLKEKRAAKEAKRQEKKINDPNPFWVEHSEQEKGKILIIVEIIEYVPNSVVIKTIIKKTTGNVTVSSFDSGEALMEKTSPFDTFIQVIDGKAEIIIDNQPHQLDTGQSIIIPAFSRNSIKANVRFKIISTIIKSGYDEIPV